MRPSSSPLSPWPTTFSLFCAVLPLASADRAEGVDYAREVKPLLIHKCSACHGALKQQGELRVDTAAAIRAGGQSGPAVTPGQPDESLLLQAVTGAAGFRMPPASEGSPLNAKEIQLLRDWISQGATGPAGELPQADPATWWSYQPLRRPATPESSPWSRTPIDGFVEASRRRAGLSPAPEASKEAWLRRVYLDLTGVPPTRRQLLDFLADDSPSAYARMADHLLAQPQYGERWGRHWMDIWRYSDWYGSRGINEIRYSQRHIWRWRDWIVDALNSDRGYDQMILEMLAGDELAGDDPRRVAATGYLGRSWYKFDRDVWLFETAERTGEAFLGLTLRCCRCHDHKYDPVSQRDYYRFRAFFEPHGVRTDPISLLVGTQKDATLGQVLEDGIPVAYDKDIEAPTFRFERGDSRYPDKSEPLSPGVPPSLQGPPVEIQPVSLPLGAWYPVLRPAVRDTLLEKSRRDIEAAEQQLSSAEAQAAAAQQQLAVRQRELPAAPAGQGNPGDPAAPPPFLDDNFMAPRPAVWTTVSGAWDYRDQKLVETEVGSFATIVTQADHPPDFTLHLEYRPLQPGTYRSVGFSFDYQDQGNSQDVYTSTGDARQSVQAFHRAGGQQIYPQEGIAAAELKVGEPAQLDVTVQGSHLTIELNGQQKLKYELPVKRRPGKLALWVHSGSAEFSRLTVRPVAETLETLRERDLAAQREVERARLSVELATARAESVAKRLQADLAVHQPDSGDKAEAEILVAEAARAQRRAQWLEARQALASLPEGDASPAGLEKLRKAEAEVESRRQALEEPLADPPYEPLGEQYPRVSTGRRSALARWIASPQNPRTARVAVNHLWGRHFGRPLVDTPENFGLNGRTPSHPELLDYLATELIAQNWSMKALHREIVLSSVYRMASQTSPADAEAAAAIDPDNRWHWKWPARRMEAEVVRDSVLHLAGRLDNAMGGPEIPETKGEEVVRRSLYFRNTPNEKMLLLEVFDVADPNSCYRRKESVVPHQSLALMNSGLVLDQARRIASLLQAELDLASGAEPAADFEARFIDAAFETILARRPTAAERTRCAQFLREHGERFRKPETGAEKFSSGGTARQPPASNPARRACENLVHVLLLHNDFVTIR